MGLWSRLQVMRCWWNHWWPEMKKPFPIFVDLDSVPPLVIGNAPALEAKIRLLLKFAPVVEVIIDHTANVDHCSLPALAQFGSKIRVLADVTYANAAAHMPGRPLVILDTMDDQLNESLSDAAKALGVPVNVPDQIALCSFYLASIVDRAPVIVAISTSGVAPVLGQNIRAKLEDMLVPKIGDLALYLWGLRDKLRHLPGALRRHIQHQIIDGSVFRHLQAGHDVAADAAVINLLKAANDSDDSASITVIEAGAGATGLLSLDAVAGIRAADMILFDENVSSEVLDLARREASLEPCFECDPERIAHRLDCARDNHYQIIYLFGGDPIMHDGATTLRHALSQRGIAFHYTASASNHNNTRQIGTPSIQRRAASSAGARVIKGVFQ